MNLGIEFEAEDEGREAAALVLLTGRGTVPVWRCEARGRSSSPSGRDPWDGSGCPAVVLTHAERARAASWDVRVQRSRGHAPHAAHGTPGALKWRYAIVLGNGAWSAYAVHDGSKWASVMLWGRTRPWFPYASITDLAEYVAARGEMDDAWYAAIADRARGKAVRARANASARAAKTKSGTGEAL